MYYDGTKLLSMKDINGNEPEIFICTGNRTGGKTTYFNRLAINRFKKYGKKFGVLYRFKYEIDDVPDKFFGEIKRLFFPKDDMLAKKICRGSFVELYLNDVPCGYAIPINSADQVKKYSHFFNDIDMLIYDEFQSITNTYCNDEVNKFINIHTSIARGEAKQYRRVPVYMIANLVDSINPYYVALDISTKMPDNCVFYRGNGFVVEKSMNESAKKAQEESPFNRAFSNANNTMVKDMNGEYANDNNAFVEKLKGKSRYLCTIKYKDSEYSIKEFTELGLVYCSSKVDSNFPIKISVTLSDHSINYVMLQRYEFMIMQLRKLFQVGCFRFENLLCKEAIIQFLSYR